MIKTGQKQHHSYLRCGEDVEWLTTNQKSTGLVHTFPALHPCVEVSFVKSLNKTLLVVICWRQCPAEEPASVCECVLMELYGPSRRVVYNYV